MSGEQAQTEKLMTAAEIGRAIVPPREKRSVLDWAAAGCPHTVGPRRGSARAKLFMLSEVVAWCQAEGIDVGVPLFGDGTKKEPAASEDKSPQRAAAPRGLVARAGGAVNTHDVGGAKWARDEMAAVLAELASKRPAADAAASVHGDYVRAIKTATQELRQLDDLVREQEAADATRMPRETATRIHVELGRTFRGAMDNLKARLPDAVRGAMLAAGLPGAGEAALLAVIGEAARTCVEMELLSVAAELERGSEELAGETNRKVAA